MKRVLSIIIVTTIIFLIGFAFLRVENEDFAATLLDDTGLDATRIRKNKEAMLSWAKMSWDVTTGSIMTWEATSGAILSGMVSNSTSLQARIEKGELPDCEWTYGEPLINYSPEELEWMKWSKQQIKEYGLWMSSAVYCWQNNWKSKTDIVKNLMTYSLSEAEAESVIMKAPK